MIREILSRYDPAVVAIFGNSVGLYTHKKKKTSTEANEKTRAIFRIVRFRDVV